MGALLLAWFFLRSLRAAGVVISPGELAARAGAVVVLFVAMLGGLAWAGHDVITIDGELARARPTAGRRAAGRHRGARDSATSAGCCPTGSGTSPTRNAEVGFTVDTVPTLLGGTGLGARRAADRPAGLAPHPTAARLGRRAPAWCGRPRPRWSRCCWWRSSAGLAAAAYAAIGDDHPKRIAGAALLGAPERGVARRPDRALRAVGRLGHRARSCSSCPTPLDELLSASLRPARHTGPAGRTGQQSLAVGGRGRADDAVRGRADRGAYAVVVAGAAWGSRGRTGRGPRFRGALCAAARRS